MQSTGAKNMANKGAAQKNSRIFRRFISPAHVSSMLTMDAMVRAAVMPR